MDATKEEYIRGLIDDLKDVKYIMPDDIPNIDLYMDQVTTFMDKHLKSSKRYSEDKLLTKTMINNYTKEGILFPPVLKKYTKNHIKMLVMIYYCKQVLSINDVKAILKPLSDNIKPPDSKEGKSNGKKNTESVDLDFLEKLYETFLSIEESKRNEFQIAMTDMMNRIETIDEELFNRSWVLLMVIDLVLQAHMRKAMAEKLIDTYIATDEE